MAPHVGEQNNYGSVWGHHNLFHVVHHVFWGGGGEKKYCKQFVNWEDDP